MSAASPTRPASRTVYEVGELIDLLRALIGDALPRVWVQGEISNFSRPASGHWYFTLKDARGQLRCAMFRNANLHVRPPPKDGDLVLVRAQPGIYVARGELQLVCEHLEPAGEGALLRAFEALKKRLAAEGLFDEANKRPLPRLPRAIGLVTSATGAAVQDVLSTLARRYPLAPVWLYPVPVQGSEAPAAIVRALTELPERAPIDVLLLVRGGGSLEDLWAFNDEAVARAIRACAVPVICGVGHEVDVTIADFAADLRAPTPTAAAERAAPDLGDWRDDLDGLQRRARHAIERHLRTAGDRLRGVDARLHVQHPQRRLHDAAQRLDELALRLGQASAARIGDRRARVQQLRTRLALHAPAQRVLLHQRRLDELRTRLTGAQQRLHTQLDARWQRSHARLEGLDPRAVLRRGYAIALDAEGRALTDAAQTAAGAALRIVLARGELDTRVERLHGDD
ncbi:exodeoxyribonuclease VII large subunit [Sinimarinibacterium thermocellulolyticum]|uniref:Exodeoxyribonuclease 7 large subunit n=1 Tax=Sinimarinibacterium thermocellulolyticum TaxID=3170016 RepID=A0ABV2ABA3_9GAMM